MSGFSGESYLIQLEDAVTPGTFNSVGSMRDTSLSIANESVDVTAESSATARQLLAQCGVNSMSLSGSGVYTSDETVSQLETTAQSRGVLQCRLISAKGDQYEGPFFIASFDRNGGYNTAEEYSTTFESASDINYTPAP